MPSKRPGTSGRELPELLASVSALRADLEHLAGVLIAEVRGLRTDLRRQPTDRGQLEDLRSALHEFFGPGPFTVAGVLMAADDDSALADAVAAVVDMNAEPMSRAVQLGKLLARLPGLQPCGDRRGARMYRVGP